VVNYRPIFKTVPRVTLHERRPRKPRWWGAVRQRVLKRDNFECQMCHQKDTRLDIHHINSLFSGGTHQIGNLIALCRPCHRKLQSLDNKPKEVEKVNRYRATKSCKLGPLTNPHETLLDVICHGF